ncbi:MAG: RNA polymerase sporulation sigma factor SigH [Clostridia bacterium]|nr:RNA polymerase sporulation sigma factor SigH [Clostridia bacterium]
MRKTYENYSDEKLVALAGNGDIIAEELLIEKYREMVKAKAHLYFIVGADTEDVVQEGMIGIFKAIRNYEEGHSASFRTFADMCVNRQILTAISSANRMKHSPLNTSVSLSRPLNEGGETLEEVIMPESDNNPETLMIVREFLEYIDGEGHDNFSAFEHLVWNEYLQGKGYRQIAEELGKTPKAVDNAIQRIRKKIAVYMGS